ncbi:diiron oxygenase [Streptomyces tirandamycinicus]|uniref:diiron oxygenase n=1 Tax=Streptomyces tirandamycinicus TaxID=2174846 RepID=UPI0034336D83
MAVNLFIPGGRLEDTLNELARSGSDTASLYESKFKNWDKRASVRVKPERILETKLPGQIYFPPELVPALSHPLVTCQPNSVRDRILVQRLYHYLHFTTELEEVAVMPVTMSISRGKSGLHLPVAMRQDALKITTDEAWHAQFSFDLARQVEETTGVGECLPDEPAFLERLSRVEASLDHDLRGMGRLAFSIVSETLISAILADLPRDNRLPDAVRELVQDHAEDEGKHHAYFRSLLEYFWGALTVSERERIGIWIPELISAFLEPDYRAVSYTLLDSGFALEEVEQVLAESYPAEVVRADVAKAARSTTRYFTEIGALESTAVCEAFTDAGLINSQD